MTFLFKNIFMIFLTVFCVNFCVTFLSQLLILKNNLKSFYSNILTLKYVYYRQKHFFFEKTLIHSFQNFFDK